MPSSGPWGTPHFSVTCADPHGPIWRFCVISLWFNWNHLKATPIIRKKKWLDNFRSIWCLSIGSKTALRSSNVKMSSPPSQCRVHGLKEVTWYPKECYLCDMGLSVRKLKYITRIIGFKSCNNLTHFKWVWPRFSGLHFIYYLKLHRPQLLSWSLG